MNIEMVLVLVFIIGAVATGIRFKKVKLLSHFSYAPGEEKILEEIPLRVEEKSVGNGKKRTTRVMNPFVVMTNKHIVIVQKKNSSPDGYIRVVLSFEPVGESFLVTWWKKGYAIIQINTTNITAVTSGEQGGYIVRFPLMSPLMAAHVEQTIEITTAQFSVYEKALGIKIPINA